MNLIKCEICNQQFKKITNTHLKIKHNTTIENYIKQYPNSIITSESLKNNLSSNLKGINYYNRHGEIKAKELIKKRKEQAQKQFQDLEQRIIRKNKNWKGYKDISGDFWTKLKSGTKKRNLEFNITIEYIWDIFEQQNGICSISGRYIFINSNLGSLNKNGYQKSTASLDRIDNSKGYIIGNVQWIHKDINKLKSNWNQDYLLEMCKEITFYQNYIKNLKH